MTYRLEADETELETSFEASKTFGFWTPRAVAPTDFAPVIRRTDHGTLYERNEIALLRYGLVPPGFSSPREADRYRLHAVRAKRTQWQREVGRLYAAGHRCLVPMTRKGELLAAAGLWGTWTRARERVESYCVFTVKDERDQWHPLLLERFDWQSWLERRVGIEELAAMSPRSGESAAEREAPPALRYGAHA